MGDWNELTLADSNNLEDEQEKLVSELINVGGARFCSKYELVLVYLILRAIYFQRQILMAYLFTTF